MTRPLAFVLGLGLSLCLAACPLGPDDVVDITGHVYGTANCTGPTRDSCTHGAPVAGATVSTSLDAQTAVTDASGYFELKGLPSKECLYTIAITAAGYPKYSVTGGWGKPKDQPFGLSNGFPQSMNQTCD